MALLGGLAIVAIGYWLIIKASDHKKEKEEEARRRYFEEHEPEDNGIKLL